MITICRPHISLNCVAVRLMKHFKHITETTPSYRRLLMTLGRSRMNPLISSQLRRRKLTPQLTFLQLLLGLVNILPPYRTLRLHNLRRLIRLSRLLNRLTPNFLQYKRLKRISCTDYFRSRRCLPGTHIRRHSVLQ